MVAFALAGLQLGIYLGTQYPGQENPRWILALVLAGSALGLLVTPYLTVYPYRWFSDLVRGLGIRELLAGVGGLGVGLLLALLIAPALMQLPDLLGRWLPLGVAVLFGYFGATLTVLRVDDLVDLAGRWNREGRPATAQGESGTSILLDTSAIIDGRIADISRTGFVRSTLTVPDFVLDELRHIADSSDDLRRKRGSRGLDVLRRLRDEGFVKVNQADAADLPAGLEVDAKLIELGKRLKAPILTNDYNLNRVAEIQGVRVLNVNDLANAVKSVVLPGEEMPVQILQPGKELGQGVGFLEDGTMVVVEGAAGRLGSVQDVVVTRVHQTVAGRMIFARLRNGTGR